jgi:inhibitor of KinA sporulation pathway (predicted exonuclease)
MIEAQSLVEKMDIRHKEINAEYSFIGQQNRGLDDAKSIRSLVDNSCSDELASLNRLGK